MKQEMLEEDHSGRKNVNLDLGILHMKYVCDIRKVVSIRQKKKKTQSLEIWSGH